MQRARETASHSVYSGLTAALLTLVSIGWLVSETIASGGLRVGARPERTGRTDFSFIAPPAPGGDGVQVRYLVSPGETFTRILRDRGLSSAEIRAWEQAAASTYSLDKLQPRHALLLTFAKDKGRLTACEYEIDRRSLLSMRLVHGQIQARLKAMPRLAAVRSVAGRIDTSLATSATAVGVPVRMISELAEVFGWEIDLRSDVRAGDEFRLIYEELRDEEGGAARPGDILAAEITSGGHKLAAIRFENEKGESEYYDPDGRALGRRFLKYPVDFVRITSQFTGSRFHPVFKRRRPHRAVDFAAPVGTPVRAVANGVVTFAGRKGQYGRQVGIRHDRPYASSYSHLHRIARGVRLGTPVRKGQVIGYVGRSGITTGPHLHFMMFKNGAYVNPLTVRLPTDEQLVGSRLARFARLRGELLERLAGLGSTVAMTAFSLAPQSLPGITRSSAASYVD